MTADDEAATLDAWGLDAARLAWDHNGSVAMCIAAYIEAAPSIKCATAALVIHAGRWARERDLPAGHLFHGHYDAMASLGCRMDDFVRWEP